MLNIAEVENNLNFSAGFLSIAKVENNLNFSIGVEAAEALIYINRLSEALLEVSGSRLPDIETIEESIEELPILVVSSSIRQGKKDSMEYMKLIDELRREVTILKQDKVALGKRNAEIHRRFNIKAQDIIDILED